MSDRHDRFFRIDIDRRHIQLKFGAGALQQEFADAFDLDAQTRLEVHFNPVGVLIFPERYFLGSDLQDCRCIIPNRDHERTGERFSVRVERVIGTDKVGFYRIAASLNMMILAAGHLHLVGGPCREQRKHTLRAAKVGHAHSGQRDTVKLFRRKRDGNPKDTAENAVFAKRDPEGFAFSKQPNVGFSDRQGERTDFEYPAGSANIRRAEFGGIRLFIAGQEVVDVVFAGIDAGLERGPRHRRHRRDRRGQRLERPLFSKLVQGRQFALIHELFGQLGVHAVQTQNDASLDAGFGKGAAIANRPDQVANRPGEHRKHPGQNG